MALIDKTVSSWHMNDDWTDSVGSNNGTPTGAVFDASIKKLGSHAGSFDTIDDRVNCGDDPSITSLTKGAWGCWIYVPSSLSGNTEYVFASYGGDTIAQVHFTRISIRTNSNSSAFNVLFRNRADTASNLITSNELFATDTWKLIWVESTGTAYKIYVDIVEESFSVGAGSNNGNWFGDITPGANAQVVWGASLVNGNYNFHCGSNIDAGFILDDATTEADRIELWNGGDGVEIGAEVAEATKYGVPTIVHSSAISVKTIQPRGIPRIVHPSIGSKFVHRK